jgi:4-hydroxybenzoate polyprenyltransferase
MPGMTEASHRQPPNAPDASDIRGETWLQRATPKAWHPYIVLARLDRPIGTWLLLLPCWWSLAMAAAAEPAAAEPAYPRLAWLAFLFALGALVMRAAGCTINDFLDRDFDAKVARTAGRPIPSGAVSPRQALIFLAVLLAVGLVILLQLTPTAIWLGIASLALVFPYPLMKRITYWPQLWLGLTFNWGALMGWAALRDGIGLPAVFLYLGGIAWTLAYDTIYAHQDKEDDALIGVKSSALKLGAATKPWLRVFFAAALAGFAAAGWAAGLGALYVAALLPLAVHFAWQVRSLDMDDPKNCLVRFKSNRDSGFLLLLAIVLAWVLA